MNVKTSAAAVAVALGLYLLMKLKSEKLPLGIRNNNPLNLREVGIPWNGKTGENGGFTTFETPHYGIRAAANNMKNSYLSGNTTIEKIISEWAPETENNTAAYIASVSQKTGIAATENITAMPQLVEIIKAMIYHENGQQPYGNALIERAVYDGALFGAALPDTFDISGGVYV
ncbi:virion protein [Aestuariibacter sp. A3R04]|uniref:virion protein n=1 Tax=Aestuariibacter sp. A3R04 TaxID=2841571 RepID=UPI001C08544D|nr:virion protein [Aestuariibacter sp. A3R04]MBU3022882.1 virion protein [Aestuariibacter sp. A3R04]